MKKLFGLLGRFGYFLCFPFLRVYLRGTQRSRVIIRSKGKILLVQGWLSDGKWMLPGGGPHKNETPIQNAAREAKEEVGIILAPANLADVGQAEMNSRGIRYTGRFFLADLTHSPALKLQWYEIQDARWFGRDEITAETCSSDVLYAVSVLDRHGELCYNNVQSVKR